MKKFFLFLCWYPLLLQAQETFSFSDLSFLKNFNASFDLSAESNLYAPSSFEYSASTGVEMTLGYVISDKMTTTLVTGVSKDLTDERQQELSDTSLYITRGIGTWKDHATFTGIGGIILPTNETSRETNTLKGALFFSPGVSVDLKSIGLKYVYFQYYFRGTLAFHEYKINLENKPNNQVNTSHSFSLSYYPMEKLGLTYTLKMTQGWTYSKNLSQPQYSSTLSLNGNITRNWDYSLGFSTRGKMYKSNGVDSNMKIYDSASTTVFVDLIISI